MWLKLKYTLLLLSIPLAGAAISGDPGAVRGGAIVINKSEFPETFNVYINPSVDSSDVFNLVYDSLLDIDPDTLEFQPLIAKSWTISPDKKTYTFLLDKKAKWSDGVSITARDVKFTYDVIMNTGNMTSVQRIFYSRFEEPVIIDDHTIVFRAKFEHYLNFANLSELNILPMHIYSGKDFNKSFNMELPCSSGPYCLTGVKEGRSYALSRSPDYWGKDLPNRAHMFNFDRIEYKVIRDNNVSFEAFKKGDYDIYTSAGPSQITPRRWFTETGGEQFQKNRIIKQKIYNHFIRGFRGLALNMRRPVFSDVRVRRALCMLLDRKTIIDKIMYGFESPVNSYWPGISDNPPLPYDPAAAKKLLIQAGYNKLDRDGYLVNKDGARLVFTILSRQDEDSIKYLTLYVESCRLAGIKADLELTSWATLIKQIDEYKFDAVNIGWQSSIFDDPEQLWHSRHAEDTAGSNLPGFKNALIDRMIDSLSGIFSIGERDKIIAGMDRIIYPDVPYILTWDYDFFPVFYKNEFGMPKTVVSKIGKAYYYNLDMQIISFWWLDPVKVKRLSEAQKNGTALLPEPVEVHYDELAAKAR
jgi:microcin C transport system substrate-binding protein